MEVNPPSRVSRRIHLITNRRPKKEMIAAMATLPQGKSSQCLPMVVTVDMESRKRPITRISWSNRTANILQERKNRLVFMERKVSGIDSLINKDQNRGRASRKRERIPTRPIRRRSKDWLSLMKREWDDMRKRKRSITRCIQSKSERYDVLQTSVIKHLFKISIFSFYFGLNPSGKLDYNQALEMRPCLSSGADDQEGMCPFLYRLVVMVTCSSAYLSTSSLPYWAKCMSGL